jgi:DNA-binding PadR family transcriptional regulator
MPAGARTSPADLTPIAFEVLLSLVDGPQHGYGIKHDIEARRGRSYRLQPAGLAALRGHLRRLNRAIDYARARKLLPVTKS